ncbi:MAG TPA: cytochrome c oxidase assembly protein, partial [Burkholderiales bacterium]|nr:cytochrome c oxidase assembly protein [Burkholderiales bacterium]
MGVRSLWRASGSARGIAGWRVAAFGTGWLALVTALTNPLDALGQVSFAAHMAQHEILMLVAAPLLVLGKPLAAFAWVLPLAYRHTALQTFRNKLWQSCWTWLVAAPVAWSVHALALWIWHAPAWFEAGLHYPLIHDLQHMSFLASALLFWWSLVRRRPDGIAVLYVLTTLLHT